MSDRLPRDREKALEAIATGKYTGRVATTAHPLCVCNRPREAEPPTPPIHNHYNCCDECGDEAWRAWKVRHNEWRRRPCPMH